MEAYFSNPCTHKKNFMQNVGERKKFVASTNPKKKIHWELRGYKEIHANTKSPNPPPLQKLNGWPLS